MVVIHPKLKPPAEAPKNPITARQHLQRNPSERRGPLDRIELRGWGPVFSAQRKAAILKGRLIELSVGRHGADCKRFYSGSVAMTKAAWEHVNQAVRGRRGCGNMAVAVAAILGASLKGKRLDLRTRIFCAFVQGMGPHSNGSFKIIEDKGDFGEVVLTIKLLAE